MVNVTQDKSDPAG